MPPCGQRDCQRAADRIAVPQRDSGVAVNCVFGPDWYKNVMSSQIISLAAQFADLGGPAGIAARLVEPGTLTLLVVGLTGLLVGRFLIHRNSD